MGPGEGPHFQSGGAGIQGLVVVDPARVVVVSRPMVVSVPGTVVPPSGSSVSQATSAKLSASADASRPLVNLFFMMLVPPKPLGVSSEWVSFHFSVDFKHGSGQRSQSSLEKPLFGWVRGEIHGPSQGQNCLGLPARPTQKLPLCGVIGVVSRQLFETLHGSQTSLRTIRLSDGNGAIQQKDR